jgi:NADH:ubiquinone oxidoreductase subunit C
MKIVERVPDNWSLFVRPEEIRLVLEFVNINHLKNMAGLDYERYGNLYVKKFAGLYGLTYVRTTKNTLSNDMQELLKSISGATKLYSFSGDYPELSNLPLPVNIFSYP